MNREETELQSRLQPEQRRIIYHMLPEDGWLQQAENSTYVTETLETEGFIHCTGEADLLVIVANNFYRAIDGHFVILCIVEEDIQARVQWDQVGFQCFPHIYGPLNLDAVMDVVPFPRDADGKFLPVEGLPA